MKIWNKYSKTGIILCGLGALVFLLWATWWDNSDFGGWVDYTWIVAVALFIVGVAKIASYSGRNAGTDL